MQMKLFKSRKTYYFYNPGTLNYERVYPSSKDRFLTVLRHLSTGIAFGVGTFLAMMYLVDSPMESRLRKENHLLQTQYEVLSLRLDEALEVLDDIQRRDENLYRTIFQAESIPESVRKAGFGGTNRYERLMSLPNAELVVSTTEKMDMLRKQLYIQSNSLEELIALGKNQEERGKCIPACHFGAVSEKQRGFANIKVFEVEYYRRIATSFAAFILTVIGLSLSSQKRKGGMGLHLGIGIGLSFSYILFQTISSTFAINGNTPPNLAVWIPNILYLFIAIYLYRKAPK